MVRYAICVLCSLFVTFMFLLLCSNSCTFFRYLLFFFLFLYLSDSNWSISPAWFLDVKNQTLLAFNGKYEQIKVVKYRKVVIVIKQLQALIVFSHFFHCVYPKQLTLFDEFLAPFVKLDAFIRLNMPTHLKS